MATVLHHVQRWLPLSAGFVAAPFAFTRHRAVVTSAERPHDPQPFPHRPVVCVERALALPAALRPRPAVLGLGAVAIAYRAHLIHAHFGYVLPQAAGPAKRLGLPLVLSLHGQDVTALPREQPRHYAGLFEAADAVVVPSRWLAEQAAAAGFLAERLRVLPSGVDTRFWAPSPLPSEPHVVTVGRLVPKKGLDVLLAAWPAVRAAVPGARLTVLGDGPMSELLASPPPGVTHLHPDAARPREQARELLLSARLVVTPSRTAPDGDAESLLLVNLEAQASGRPLVTTRHGGIPEYVEDGRTAIVVPEADPAALAQGITAVLTDVGLALRLAANGPAAASLLDIRLTAARLDDLYDELVAARGSRWPSRRR